jgi:hypothetical protein
VHLLRAAFLPYRKAYKRCARQQSGDSRLLKSVQKRPTFHKSADKRRDQRLQPERITVCRWKESAFEVPVTGRVLGQATG